MFLSFELDPMEEPVRIAFGAIANDMSQLVKFLFSILL